jgi:hypothetical protein
MSRPPTYPLETALMKPLFQLGKTLVQIVNFDDRWVPVEARHSLLHLRNLSQPFFGPISLPSPPPLDPSTSTKTDDISTKTLPILVRPGESSLANLSTPYVLSDGSTLDLPNFSLYTALYPSIHTFDSWKVSLGRYVGSGRLWDVYSAIIVPAQGHRSPSEMTRKPARPFTPTRRSTTHLLPSPPNSDPDTDSDTGDIPRSTSLPSYHTAARHPPPLLTVTTTPLIQATTTPYNAPLTTPWSVVVKFNCPRIDHSLKDGDSGYRIQPGLTELQVRKRVMREVEVYKRLGSDEAGAGVRITPKLYGLFGSLQLCSRDDEETWMMVLEDCGGDLTGKVLGKYR